MSTEASAGWQPLGKPTRVRAPRTANEEAFLRLALTHAFVMGADAMVTVALARSIFFSTNINDARWRVLLSLLLTMAPFAVVAPFLGPAIDRSKSGRRLMVVLSAAGRCVTALFMAREVGHLVLFLPAALVLLILSKGHAVAKSSLVPATVDSPEDLVKAGARLAVLAALASFAAGGAAAGLSALFGADWVLRTAAVLYAVGALLAVRTRPAPPSVPDPPDHVDEIVRSRGVTLAATAMAAIRGVSGFLTFGVAFLFKRADHGHGAPAWWYGVVVAAAVLGGFCGNLIGPRVRQRVREERIMALSLAGLAAVAVFAAVSGGRAALALVALTVGIADGLGQLAFDAIVQRDGCEGSRGRSFARFEATFQMVWVAGAVIPVAVPLAGWAVGLLVALASGGAAAYYVAGRQVVERAAHRPQASGVEAAGGGVEPAGGGVEPAGGGVEPAGGGVEPAGGAPRRNPYRSGRGRS